MMRTFVKCCLSLLLMSSVCLAKAQIVNSGFESMTTNPDTSRLEPDNWSTYSQSGSTVYFAGKTDVVYSGSYSEKIAARNGYGMIYQEISSGFSVGETYSFWLFGRGDTNSGWQMNEPGDRVDLFVKFMDASGAQIGDEISTILFDTDQQTSAPVLDTEIWLKSEIFQFTIPADTASFLIKIRSVDGTVDGGRVDGTSVYLDDVSLDILPLAAKDPEPADKSTEQPVTGVSLGWTAGDDPYNVGVPNDEISGYFLYLEVYDIDNDPGEPNSIDDPNYVSSEPIELTESEYDSLDVTFGYDKVVYWRVDQSINGSSTDSSATVDGPWWSFYTERSFPEIATQPQDITVIEGQYAEISIIAAQSAYPVVLYEWYNADDELVLSGEDATSIVFDSATTADAGGYYCVLTNNQDKQVVSDVAVLSVQGMLLKYDFENDLSDSTGNFDGIATNFDPNYPIGITYNSAGIDGSAVIFDGESYCDLGIDAYPNKDQGLSSGTLICWFKKDNDITGTIIAAYNDNHTTCYNLSLQSGEKIYFYIRAESGAFTTVQLTAQGIFDDQWHQVAITYDLGSNTDLYLDGEIIGSSDGLGVNEIFADWNYSMVIGAGNTRGEISNPYTNSLDAFVLYNYPITNKEILDMYNTYSPEEKSLCLDSYASTFDLAGPDGVGAQYADCQVDMLDFAAMASVWLDCGLYPACDGE